MSAPSFLSDVIELSDDLDVFNEYAMAQGWSDGLPLIPPTEARVERMLQGYERTSGTVVAHLPVEEASCTVEKIAINAVMAGCKLSYMPLLIATVQAVADPAFNLTAIQATTNPVAPMIIVNGPIRHRLEINCGYGCFGPGWQANATIGRVLRLLLINVGGRRSWGARYVGDGPAEQIHHVRWGERRGESVGAVARRAWLTT
ncbi:hypothetical protein C2W62_05255 [Candidatus Entotheonella serta]|nr:hypothetical protein C2W62_05255 [Candidatus Entotheonella serta]